MRTVKQLLKSELHAESDAFVRLQAEYIDRFSPVTVEERYLVVTLIRNEWLLRRLRLARVQLAEICDKSSPAAKLLERRIRTAEKTYKQASAQLERRRASFLESWPADSERWVM